MRILLVDVTPSQRDAVKTLFPGNNHDVVECSPIMTGEKHVAEAHWDLIVAHDLRADPELSESIDRLKAKSQKTPIVLIHSQRGYRPELMTNLLRTERCHHYVGGNTPQTDVTLTRTIRQLLGEAAWDLTSDLDVPGLEHTVTSSLDKRDTLLAIEQWCNELNLRQRQTNAVVGVADECLMNAMFHAPIDDAGTRPYTACPRSDPLQLSPAEAPSIRTIATADHIAVITRDPFGSLVADTALDWVLTCMTGALDPMQSPRPSTGMGLFLTFCNSSHVNIAIHPGHWTQLVALINRTTTFREFAAQPKGLTVFSHR